MSYQTLDFKRSIARKQAAAVTGLGLILFVIFHLIGNLFIICGPQAYNGYSHKLESFGIILKCAEWGLFFVFLFHIERVTTLVIGNIRAKGLKRYEVDSSKGDRSWATRLMPISGFFLIVYLIWHLYDFAWADPAGIRSFINGKNYGLYGIVVNSFKDPTHAYLYVLAMCCLGLHLAHGVQSFIQTFGFSEHRFTPIIRKFSQYFALGMTVVYSYIPIYILYFLKI